MSNNNSIYGIILLFNDIIGTVVPGIILISGLLAFSNIPDMILINDQIPLEGTSWIIFLATSYIIGHSVISTHYRLMQLQNKLNRSKLMKFILKSYYKIPFAPKYAIYSPINIEQTYKPLVHFIKTSLARVIGEDNDVKPLDNDYRSIVMTLSKEAGQTTRRFIFLSVACHGSAASIGFAYILVRCFPNNNLTNIELLYGALISLAVSTSLNARGFYFNDKAQRVAFPIATAELLIQQTSDEA